MAYESTMVSTTAPTAALRQVLCEPTCLVHWPGFHGPERHDGRSTVWRTSRVASRSFPPSGRWEVEHRVVRDDHERPEVDLTCTSGRSSVHLTVEVWTLAPHVRLVRVGIRHGSTGRLRYSARKLRRASQDFGKAVAVAAGGEVLERVGIETVQRLGILDVPDEPGRSGDEVDDPDLDVDAGRW